MSRWALVLWLCVGCSSGGAKPSGADGAAGHYDAHVEDPGDGGTSQDLATANADLWGVDLKGGADLSPAPDLSPPRDLSAAPDLGFPTSQNVEIFVDNFCKMDVLPKKFDVPAGTFLKLTYFNRSRDYPVDVWLSYGGGFLDLKTGTSWADRFEFCRYPRPYSAYADISTACSKYRLMINCL